MNMTSGASFDLPDTCEYTRVQGSTQLIRSCPDEFEVLDFIDEKFVSLFKSKDISQKKYGKPLQAWSQVNKKEVSALVQFEDLSLHLFKGSDNLAAKWIREEGLSAIDQVELAEGEQTMAKADFDYFKRWNEPVTFAQVPTRIVSRLTENLSYAIKNL